MNINQEITLAFFYSMINPPDYFARIINYSIKGLGALDTLLIRIIVKRYDKDIPEIKQMYKHIYNKDMIDDNKNDTSGKY